MSITSSTESHEISPDQKTNLCCCRLTVLDTIALIASAALGALACTLTGFAISNPIGWVTCATISSGLLAGAFIWLITVTAYRHFNGSAKDASSNEDEEGTSMEKRGIFDTQDFSSSLDDPNSHSFKSVSEEGNVLSQLHVNLLLQLVNTISCLEINNKLKIRVKPQKSVVEKIISYGFLKGLIQKYNEWNSIWESDSISWYPHLLNSLLTIDIAKMKGSTVKGFTYDERPFIAFKLDSEVDYTDKATMGKAGLCILYNASSTSTVEKKYKIEIFDFNGNWLADLNFDQFRSLLKHGQIIGSESNEESGNLI